MEPDPDAAGTPPGVVPTPLNALERVIGDALRRPPCGVAFSGGVDSSVVLATAVRAARAGGMEAPIALTLRYPGDPAADETAEQERVIHALGVREWTRITITDEVDAIGPLAAAHLCAHGVLWPPTVHRAAPLLAALGGGTLLTGEGGDEVLGPTRATPVVGALRRRPRPTAALAGAIATALLPGPARRRVLCRDLRRRRAGAWLTPPARAAYLSARAAEEAAEPLAWPAAVRRQRRRRAVLIGEANAHAYAAERGVEQVDPFVHPTVVEALLGAGGRWGWVTRSEAVHRLFGGLLPADVLLRRTKATFNGSAVTGTARNFARRWDGGGLDDDVAALVVPEAVRAAWLAPVPHALSLLLLQAAWLGTVR